MDRLIRVQISILTLHFDNSPNPNWEGSGKFPSPVLSKFPTILLPRQFTFQANFSLICIFSIVSDIEVESFLLYEIVDISHALRSFLFHRLFRSCFLNSMINILFSLYLMVKYYTLSCLLPNFGFSGSFWRLLF